MFNKSFNQIIFILFISCFFLGCNKESFIENQGTTSTVGVDPSNNKGSYTIFTTNANVPVCSNGLTVYIDGTAREEP